MNMLRWFEAIGVRASAPSEASSKGLMRRFPKIKKRYLLAILLLLGAGLWLSVSAYVAWRYTRRSQPPFPQPAPQLASAKVEDQRFETADGEQIGAWLIRGELSATKLSLVVSFSLWG
jgi:hypothetical protein